jgi:hypothetical protein
MVYEVEATLTLQRESMAGIVGMSADKRAFASAIEINSGVYPQTPIKAHTTDENTCHMAVLFATEGKAQEFIDWLGTLVPHLRFEELDENYYIFKTVEGTIEITDSHQFAPVTPQEPDIYSEWRQPTSSLDAYSSGDIVRFRSSLYQSTVNYNVHMPTVSGWHTYSLDGGPTAWVQPSGEHDAYKMGDIVMHNDQTWIVTQTDANGNNVWEPGVFGWEVYP